MLLHLYMWGAISFMGFCRISKADASDSSSYHRGLSALFTGSVWMLLSPWISQTPITWPETMMGFGLFFYLLATAKHRNKDGTICQE